MQTVSCPSCGAQVKFRSHASVMAVCEYCSSSVLKEASAVRDLGKMSAVLEDYSPLQIGSAGVIGGRPFNVIGRLQLKYQAGMWNEWYLLFDDASSGWLGDSSGMYVITAERKVEGALPPFGAIIPGRAYAIDGEHFTAAEVRRADCIGGQGELPFKVGAGYQVQVADFRRGSQFVTLDYSEAPHPTVYRGVAVTLEALQCQLLREEDAIERTAGRYRGKLDALDCPSCGSPIKYLPGMTAHLLCPACHAQIDAASPQAQVLAIGERVTAVRTTLELGAQAKLNHQDYTVIGMLRRVDEEGTPWTEYLLYGTRAGFSWLIETAEGWSRANVMPEWPEPGQPDAASVVVDTMRFDKLYAYEARVSYAIGAFNWRVHVGDRTRVAEFAQGQIRLAAESTAQELSWSRSVPVPFDQMQAWFGQQFSGQPAKQVLGQHQRYQRVARNTIMVMLALNAIPLLANFSGTWALSALGALALYLPALYLDSKED